MIGRASIAIFKKELTELFRSKRTIFVMFILPLILYPIIIIGISTVVMKIEQKQEAESSIIGVSADDSGLYATVSAFDGIDVVTVPAGEEVSAINDGIADAIISKDGENYVVTYNSSVSRSERAYSGLEKKLSELKTETTEKLLEQNGLDKGTILNPFEIRQNDTASEEQTVGSILGSVIPILLIIGVFLGSMIPTLDVTAGEKERGTQETLMTFPISGSELLSGKILTVGFFGVLSSLLYMVTVGILGVYLSSMLGTLGVEFSLNLSTFIGPLFLTAVAVAAFAVFIGTVMICICMFAESTKEAESLLSVVLVVIMFVSYIGFLDISLTKTLSIVPVLNVVLLIKSVFALNYDFTAIILVVLSNIAYASAAILVAGKMYTSERLLFKEHEGTLINRNTIRAKGSLPAVGDGILVLAVGMMLNLYLGSLFQLKFGLPGVGISQLIFAVVAISAVWFGKTDYHAVFSLKKLKIGTVLPIIILAMGSFILFNTVCNPIAELFEDSSNEYMDIMSQLEEGQSFWSMLFFAALAPAVCEEILFRGYFLSSLRKSVKPVVAIAVSALSFGIYHLNLYQGCYAFLLGLVLAYAVYKTGSIFSSMLIHFICNGIAMVLTFYGDKLENLLPFLSGNSPLVFIIFLAVGLALTSVGILLLNRKTKSAG